MSRFSHLSHLECARCGRRHDASAVQGVCDCGSPLLARYDLESARRDVERGQIASRANDMWRYHEVLPVQDPGHVVTLGEGMTPLLPLPRLGREIGIPRLLMKDESLIPTGTFKARGAAAGISRAAELGLTRVAMPTNGNAGAAWALYAARAGIEMLVIMPVDAPRITRSECAASGADLYLVDGLIGDAGAIVAGEAERNGWFNASTLREPYRIEGKKTMAYEIAEQLGWRLPDVILYPAGGGVGIIGIHKALQELRALGWVDGPAPRLVAVQASGCAPLVRAWEAGARESEPWPDGATIAFGINVPKALGDFLVLDALYDTEGCAVAVDDAVIVEDVERIARAEGCFVCPEGAATLSAARELRSAGWIGEHETVVLLNTGAGIKYPGVVQTEPAVLAPGTQAIPD